MKTIKVSSVTHRDWELEEEYTVLMKSSRASWFSFVG